MNCARCGNKLADERGIEGFCPRCFAGTAFDWGAGEEGVGDSVAGFEIIEEIGRGGSGIVYRARQARLNREVALKVLHVGPWSRPDVRERFRREATATAALRHPNVVTVYEAGEIDGHAYLAMELVTGRSLAEMTRDGPLPPERAARYALDVAEGISAAHAKGILHRDLKPANVLIDEKDRARVADFGLAKTLDPAGEIGPERREFTLPGQVLGSPGYMPPEQADPARGTMTFASDVYSLGAMLYHLVTGRPPFAGSTVAATLAQVLGDDPAPPRRLNSGVPRDLETICLRCLQKEPERRYATLAEVAADLSAFLRHRPIQARPISVGERIYLWCRRRPRLALLAFVAIGMALAGTGTVLWQAAENRRNLYAADLRLASLAVEEGDYGRARALLSAHAPSGQFSEPDFLWRHLHQVSQGDERRVLGEHPWIVDCVAWSPDGGRLASGSVGSGTVGADTRIWDMRADPPGMRVLIDRGARQLAWFPDGRHLLVTHPDGEVGIYDVSNGVRTAVFAGTSAALSADGRRLLTCEGDRWSWEPDGQPAAVTLHDLDKGGETALGKARWSTMTPDATRVVMTDLREKIRVIEIGSGRLVDAHRLPDVAWSLGISPDGRWLVSAGFGGRVPLWDLTRPESEIRFLVGHEKGIWQVAFSPDGRRAATASTDQSIRLWDLSTGTQERVLRGHGSEVWCAAFSPDGTQLASGGKDRSVVVWSVDGKPRRDEVVGRSYATLVFASDSRWVAAVDPSDATRTLVQDRGSGGPPTVVPQAQPLAFAADPSRLLTMNSGYGLREIEWRTGRVLRETTLAHETNEPAPHRVVATPGGDWAAGIHRGGGVSIWNTATGQRLSRWSIPAENPWFVHLSDDGMWCAVTTGEAGFWVGSVSWQEMRRITAHRDMAKWAAFSRDGRWLATASVDATIGLWRLPDLKLDRFLRGHPTEVSCVAFAAENNLLVSSEQRNGLRFWDLRTGREIGVLHLPEVEPGLVFSEDGLALGVCLGNGRWRLLEAPR
ncbi:MAG: serine/threonine protein kinase [Verrucomicrobiales bacterium]|nr:serine/threonine protein kinase [Verrucomicrobiales bacterium]